VDAAPGERGGTAELLRLGARDDFGPAAPGPRPAAGTTVALRPGDPPNPREEILKLTRVRFFDNMHANDLSRLVTFRGQVEVWHFPAESLDATVDIERLPDGGMYLRCDKLDIYTERVSATESYQQGTATGHALVKTPEIMGQGDVIKYDEQRGSVIIEGTPANPALLFHVKKGQGAIRGRKITYW